MITLLLAALLAQSPDPQAAAALERVNHHRKLAGLDPVVLDPAISKGCAAHAEYLVKNAGQSSTQGLGAHNEDPKLPGYTKEGERAGHASDIFFGKEGAEAVEGWMATLFHRVPVLEPYLRKIGYGSAKDSKGDVTVVLDVLSGTGSGKRIPLIAYPADKQKDVPLEFGGEIPDPVPDASDKHVGYPVTVSFSDGPPVKEAQALLKTDAGKTVEFWMSTPEKPANATYQRNTICLMSKQPLEPGTTYTVTVAAKLGGKPWTRTWTFTTRAK